VYGTGVDIPVYAALAVLTGGITYSALNDITDIRERRQDPRERAIERANGDSDENGDEDEPPELDPDIDRETEQLREERS